MTGHKPSSKKKHKRTRLNVTNSNILEKKARPPLSPYVPVPVTQSPDGTGALQDYSATGIGQDTQETTINHVDADAAVAGISGCVDGIR